MPFTLWGERRSRTTEKDVDRWVERLAHIPDAHRRFTVDLQQAEAVFGLSPSFCHELVERGISHEGDRGEPRFAECDLHYIALRLGHAPVHKTAMSLWAKTLIDSTTRPVTDLLVNVSPYAPPGTEVQALTPSGHERCVTTEQGRPALSLSLQSTSEWPAFEPPIADMLCDVARYEFCLVPLAVPDPVGLARECGLLSCKGASIHVVQACEQLGVEARPAYGLLLSRPFATTTHWAEVRVADRWVPVSPVLLATMVDLGFLDERQWPPSRTWGGVLLRLASTETALVRDMDGEPVASSFRVSLVTNAETGASAG